MKKISKTQIAKNLGISRPTLNKRLQNGENINLPELDIESLPNDIRTRLRV